MKVIPHSTGSLPAGLALGELNKAEWDQPTTRRLGLRQLHRLHRYGLSFRAARVLPLETCINYKLHDVASLRWYLSHPFFTGVIALVGQRVVFEHYASDFGPEQVHSVQSITKTVMNLVAGKLIESRALDPTLPVVDYLPELAAGYREASVQDTLDMAVVNNYSEDFYNPQATVGRLEDAHGWRFAGIDPHVDIRTFLSQINGTRRPGNARTLHYKSANTDVVAWVCERRAQRSLRELYLEIIEAAGMADTVYLSTDRQGVPFAGGGLHMTLRDLARYGLLLARGGIGEHVTVGSRKFLDITRTERGEGTPSLLGMGHYRNFLETNGTWLGHNGYGGQWLMVYPEAQIVIACLSGIADDGGLDWTFIRRLAAMGEDLARALPGR